VKLQNVQKMVPFLAHPVGGIMVRGGYARNKFFPAASAEDTLWWVNLDFVWKCWNS